MPTPFRVGYSRDFLTFGKELLEPALEKWLGMDPAITWEPLPQEGPEALPEVIDAYDAIISGLLRFTSGSFAGVRRLTLIARWGVGYDRIDVPACTASDVILAITPDGVRRPVAEGALTLILALSKHLLTHDRSTRAGHWRGTPVPLGICLPGRVLGTVGFGNIVAELCRLARPLGFRRLLACDPYPNPGLAEELGVELVELEVLLRESDFVAINCPLNEETHHLIGEQELALMKPTAYLINTARGPIVDQRALVQVLQQGRIAGAGLDVFDQEPPNPDDPLLKLDNVILTPHAIAWTEESVRDNGAGACQACLAVARGEAPRHVVNREVLEKPTLQAKLARYREGMGPSR